MVLKLTICRETEGDEASFEYLFSQEHITIGRGEANHLTLSGTPALVREKHVFVRRSDGACRVLSCGAEDRTRINGDGIPALQPQEIQDGDVLEVGPFQIEFQFLEESDPATTADPEAEPSNPFQDPVARLASALDALATTYEEADPDRREEALADAVRTDGGSESTEEAVRAAVTALVGGPTETRSDGVGDESHLQGPFIVDGEERPVLKTVTDALATVLEVPYQFRHEFIGHSLSHPSDARFLYEGDGAALRSTLLDSSESGAEREQRLQYVDEAAEALVRHQIAVVEGYKASVSHGVKELLTRVDPEEHRDAVLDTNDVFRYVPALAQPAILRRVREACHDLRKEDWAVAEQRIFRPAFRKAYLTHMTAPHGTDDEHEQNG
jgi:hypothetical protein